MPLDTKSPEDVSLVLCTTRRPKRVQRTSQAITKATTTARDENEDYLRRIEASGTSHLLKTPKLLSNWIRSEKSARLMKLPNKLLPIME